jgi:hypothetical protein
MTQIPYSTIVAGPADVVLAFIVVSTCVLALAIDLAALSAWLRRRR